MTIYKILITQLRIIKSFLKQLTIAFVIKQSRNMIFICERTNEQNSYTNYL